MAAQFNDKVMNWRVKLLEQEICRARSKGSTSRCFGQIGAEYVRQDQGCN